jgi:hypothetical protein
MKWYKRDPDAAIAGMSELTMEECGVYTIVIIDYLYSRDGDLPTDDRFFARACRIFKKCLSDELRSLRKHSSLQWTRGRQDSCRGPPRGRCLENSGGCNGGLSMKRAAEQPPPVIGFLGSDTPDLYADHLRVPSA